MFKRILSRTAIAIRQNLASVLIIICVLTVFCVYFINQLHSFDTPSAAAIPSTISTEIAPRCDQAFMELIAGEPGDDAFLYNCAKDQSGGPTSIEEVAKVRSTFITHPHAKDYLGTFKSDNGSTAYVYVLFDHYPETMYTIFLDSQGNILNVE